MALIMLLSIKAGIMQDMAGRQTLVSVHFSLLNTSEAV